MKDLWQPIETAPQDGTRILLAVPNGRGHSITLGHWDLQPHHKKPDPYWSRADFMGVANHRSTPPTHWQPLEPPTA